MSESSNKKIVIAIASSALFDLSESDRVFKKQGIEKYKKYQEKNINKTLKRGVAFPFISRFLKLNDIFPGEDHVEVVLLSKNSHETGLRVFNSIKKYGLKITKAGFFSGESPYKYIPAFGASLFLSANSEDVKKAIDAGYPAGRVIDTKIKDNEKDKELRIAFDFDGVLADGSAEDVFQAKGLKKFQASETKKSRKSLKPGPLNDFIKQIMHFRKLELEKIKKDKKYKQFLKIAIITARTAPSHKRLVHTLKEWGVSVDESFFLGDSKKKQIIDIMKPHIYFDDQERHFKDIYKIPLVHIPFGKLNETK